MNNYELAFIITPNVDAEGVTSIVDKVKQFVGGINGEVTSVDVWGRRKLAYFINLHKEGTYVLFNAAMPPVGIVELERNLKLSGEIIRYLLVRIKN